MASSSQCHSSPCHGISLWCCSSKVMDAPAAFPTLCPSGEVMPWALSSHFTFWGPGVRGQEQSWAAPVVVTLQDWDWSWGHCQGRRERLIYLCLKVPTTRKFLIISAQGAFICQWECFDRGLLPRQAAWLVSCAGRKRGKRNLINRSVVTPPSSPSSYNAQFTGIQPCSLSENTILTIAVWTQEKHCPKPSYFQH